MNVKPGLALAMAFTTGAADPPPAAVAQPIVIDAVQRPVDQIKLLTYNVAGLPWPAASGRPQALQRIGDRLAALRRQGQAPHVVVLQEAFTSEALAIGARAGYRYQARVPDADAPRAAAPRLALPGGRRRLRAQAMQPWLV